MTTLKDFLQVASSEKNGGPLGKILGVEIDLGDMGPYPLSTMTSLADSGAGVPFESGEVRIEFSDVTVGAVAITGVTATEDEDAGKLIVHFAPMRLHGVYSVVAIDQPHIDIDTGGSLMPLESLAGPSAQPTMSQKLYDQLNQANDQREKLKQTTNGQQLVANYHTYNDTYNSVFQTNTSLRTYWKARGATAKMADQTSTAVTAGNAPINDGSEYGPQNITYNTNSGQQSFFLISACNAVGKYTAAAQVTSFSSGVIKNVGTQKGKPKTIDNLNAMTADGIFTTVKNVKKEDIISNDDHVKKVIDTIHRVGKDEHNAEDVSFISETGIELTDYVIKGIQEIYAEGIRQKQPEAMKELWNGRISCNFPKSTFTFSLVDHHQGAIATTLLKQNVSVEKLKIDDESWTGEAGDIAKKRVNSALFIHGLMSSKISNIFEHKLAQYISSHVRAIERE